MVDPDHSVESPDDADVDGLLDRVSSADRVDRAPSFDDSLRLTALMATRAGRERLRRRIARLDRATPFGPGLTYVDAAVSAKAGLFETAYVTVKAALAVAEGARRRRIERVLSVIDLISYEAKSETDEADADLPTKKTLLEQGRLMDYVASRRKRLAATRSLADKLQVVRSMTAAAQRPIADYGPAFAAAREEFARLWPAVRRMAGSIVALAEGRVREPLATFAAWYGLARSRTLTRALGVAAKLRLAEETEILSRALFALASHPLGRLARWPIVATLVDVDHGRWSEPTRALMRARPTRPITSPEVKFCFDWAMRCGEYAIAEDIHTHLPRRLKTRPSAEAFATILERLGRFGAARDLVAEHSARRFSRLDRSDALAHWKAVVRLGQIDFSLRTAEVLSETPQPTAPAGVLFVLARTANLASLLPLAMLEEMRRRNWAIVPLVEGVLPLDPTGRAEIDRFLGAIHATGRLRRDLAADPAPAVVADVTQGRLGIDDLDFDQILWEEAAIKQRRYRVEYGCPSLARFLERRVTWAVSVASVLRSARAAMAAVGLPAGVLVTFRARIPDAVVHDWCARYGDPERFFCVQGANGYQNYFANFSEPVSSRMAVRNMTAAARLRSPSFPTAEEFTDFLERIRPEGPEMLHRVRDVTRLRRSARVGSHHPAAAEKLLQQVRRWRASGGKVACAFGKVVCDSGVPVDGGPAHRSMADWLNHTVATVAGSRTLLLVKPHPHERRNEIGAFLTETFEDLIEVPRSDNVRVLGHDWFDMADLDGVIDLGLVYNGTSAIELGLLGIPAILCSHYASLDYPIGQCVPRDRAHYERLIRFEEAAEVAPDLPLRAAAWLHYLSGDERIKDYRYHARPITNRSINPPWWFEDDLAAHHSERDPAIASLADEITLPGMISPEAASRHLDHQAVFDQRADQ